MHAAVDIVVSVFACRAFEGQFVLITVSPIKQTKQFKEVLMALDKGRFVVCARAQLFSVLPGSAITKCWFTAK